MVLKAPEEPRKIEKNEKFSDEIKTKYLELMGGFKRNGVYYEVFNENTLLWDEEKSEFVVASPWLASFTDCKFVDYPNERRNKYFLQDHFYN